MEVQKISLSLDLCLQDTGLPRSFTHRSPIRSNTALPTFISSSIQRSFHLTSTIHLTPIPVQKNSNTSNSPWALLRGQLICLDLHPDPKPPPSCIWGKSWLIQSHVCQGLLGQFDSDWSGERGASGWKGTEMAFCFLLVDQRLFPFLGVQACSLSALHRRSLTSKGRVLNRSSSTTSPLRFSIGHSPSSTGKHSRRFPRSSICDRFISSPTREGRDCSTLFPRFKVLSFLHWNSSGGRLSIWKRETNHRQSHQQTWKYLQKWPTSQYEAPGFRESLFSIIHFSLEWVPAFWASCFGCFQHFDCMVSSFRHRTSYKRSPMMVAKADIVSKARIRGP